MKSATYFFISGLIDDEKIDLLSADFSIHGRRAEKARRIRMEECDRAQAELDELHTSQKPSKRKKRTP